MSGRQLDAYLAAGVESDHECTELEEAEEKRRKGMWIFIREGSASRNLAALIPTVIRHGTDRVALCTDDREPDTLLHSGHVNDCVRLAVAAGVRVEDALVLATSNPADYHRLRPSGLARARLPGRRAVLRRPGELRAGSCLAGGQARGDERRSSCPGAVPAVARPGLDARTRSTSRAPPGRTPSTASRPPVVAPGSSASRPTRSPPATSCST